MEKWLGSYTIREIPKLGTMTLVDKDDTIIGKYRQNNIKNIMKLQKPNYQQRMMTKMRRM